MLEQGWHHVKLLLICLRAVDVSLHLSATNQGVPFKITITTEQIISSGL